MWLVLFAVDLAVVPPEFQRNHPIALGELEADTGVQRVSFLVHAGVALSLDNGRVTQLECAERHVDGVAGHVAQGTGTIV